MSVSLPPPLLLPPPPPPAPTPVFLFAPKTPNSVSINPVAAITLDNLRVTWPTTYTSPYVLTQTETDVAGFDKAERDYKQRILSAHSQVTVYADILTEQLATYPGLVVTIDGTSARDNGNCLATSTGTCTYYLAVSVPFGTTTAAATVGCRN